MPCVNHLSVETGLVLCSRCVQTFCSDCVVEIDGALLCGRCKQEQLGDLRSGIDTTRLQLSSIGKRFAAVFIDGLVLAIPTYGISFGIMFWFIQSGQQPGLLLQLLIGVAASIPMVIYEGLMLSARGQTLGKMAMKIKVVTPEGNDLARGQAWTRAVTRFLFASLLSLVNYIPALVTKDKTAVHDMVAKTRVAVWLA
jgi:uncharacterized RDD family membrane protein YckC